MSMLTSLLHQHRPAVVLLAILLVLTGIPAVNTLFVLGEAFPAIPPTFTDETFYYARVQTVVEGHPFGGHPYFLERSAETPLVIFGGLWLSAIPQLLGATFNQALMINMIVWTLLFGITLYWLLRELRVLPWIAVLGALPLYLESYGHMWRPANLQSVYPIYFLFYIALLRFIRDQSRKNMIFLALMIGATFYFFAFLWQVAVVTLGLLFLYAIVRKNWKLAKATFITSFAGGVIGLPVPLYMLWRSHTSPYFWESFRRLGLTDTHLPMAEIVYSGGWIWVAFFLIGLLWWRVRTLRQDTDFSKLALFFTVSGLGLWIMQGGNAITGKLLETGEHMKIMILPWLMFSTIALAALVWKHRHVLTRTLRVAAVALLVLLGGANAYFIHHYFFPYFLPMNVNQELWKEQQTYVGPFTWLDEHEPEPVVVWSNPRHYLTTNLPIFTRHFTLYAYFGLLEHVPEGEIRERYLVSQYFENPDAEYLKETVNMELYLGRHDIPHKAKTIERGIKICRIIFFFDTNKDCGTVPSPRDLLGNAFFENLEGRFAHDIRPNIHAYLAKYHVSYILKDKLRDTHYRPEALGAIRVYADDRYELYKL